MERDNNSLIDIDDINDSLFEHYSFKADPGQSPLRVDKFLMSRIENVTRNKIQQAAKAGNIFVSDRIVKSNYKIKGGEIVKVLFSHPPYKNLLTPEKIPLDIIFEDDFFCKKRNFSLHPIRGGSYYGHQNLESSRVVTGFGAFLFRHSPNLMNIR